MSVTIEWLHVYRWLVRDSHPSLRILRCAVDKSSKFSCPCCPCGLRLCALCNCGLWRDEWTSYVSCLSLLLRSSKCDSTFMDSLWSRATTETDLATNYKMSVQCPCSLCYFCRVSYMYCQWRTAGTSTSRTDRVINDHEPNIGTQFVVCSAFSSFLKKKGVFFWPIHS